LADSAETEERNSVLSSFSEIFKIMEHIDDSFIVMKRNGARYAGVAAGGIIFLLGMIAVPFILNYMFPITPGSHGLPESFWILFRTTLIIIPILSIVTGIITYFYVKKSYIKPFVSHKTKLQELSKAINEKTTKETNFIEKILQLIDQMSSWAPKLITYKGDEAQAYGIAAFLLVALVSFFSGTLYVGIPVSLLIGVIVWIYFRYEKRKEAELQLQEFRAWKKRFEEEKNGFLETL
jgi:hypothetical protein